MATQEQIESTYNYMDELFRITYGEHGDCSGAMYDGDFSLTLEQAQKVKHDYVLDNLHISPRKRILDVGCGWGSVLDAARQRGAWGIGITLSTKQAEACRRNGLEVYIKDWRDLTSQTFGAFEGVVSIGSFEHFCSEEEFVAGQQQEVYRRFMKLCAEFLPTGGRLYLQTMMWGRNAPQPHAISLKAQKGSNEYVVAVLKKFYPGSWLPSGMDQIVSCAQPYLRLISAKNGRLDYIQTMNQWGRTWRFSPRKLLPSLKSLRYFFVDPDFRYKVETLVRNYNQECFKREIMDHQRMVFEKI
ncbi:MAG: class I SAM-dependent methyltransferase [Terriglobales bacterium]|jgi:cyclopropane-fatty-acyl-phospholipid synthase